MKETMCELYKFYDVFNGIFFNEDLGECVITIQSKGRKKGILGWFTKKKIWCKEGRELHEINITTEYLKRDKYEILSTLLHEMCHLYNSNQGIKDVSKSGNHNKCFKECAEEHGLNCEKADKIGWSVTSLTEETINIINEIGISEDAFKIHMKFEEKEDKEKKPKQPSKSYVCSKCGTKFKMKKDLSLICGKCNHPFEVTEE